MSDNESHSSNSEGDESTDFNPWFSDLDGITDGEHRYLSEFPNLQHVEGKELGEVLPEHYDKMAFEGDITRESKEYKRVLYLLQSSRRWRLIVLSDLNQTKATPEFLSLVVLAVTKTSQVELQDCPLDFNFFACLNSGMNTLTDITVSCSEMPISYEAAEMFATGLASSSSLRHLVLDEGCLFEPGAGLKLTDGIKQNTSLTHLNVVESNLGTEAMISVLRAISKGEIPQLSCLWVDLTSIFAEEESICTKFVTRLMCSDTCRLEELNVQAKHNYFPTDDIQTGGPNPNLKSLNLIFASWEKSYFEKLLPMVPNLSKLRLLACATRVSDVPLIIDYLRCPDAVMREICIDECSIGVEQCEKFVESLPAMQSLRKFKCINCKGWDKDNIAERIQNMMKKASKLWNMEEVIIYKCYSKRVKDMDITLDLAINRAWRRELCYKKSSPPLKLLPHVFARALRRTECAQRYETYDLCPDVVLSLLRERMSDLMPAPND